MGHGALKVNAFRLIIRFVIVATILFEFVVASTSNNLTPFSSNVQITMCVATAVILFLFGRKLISSILTPLDAIASLRVITEPIRFRKEARRATFSAPPPTPTPAPAPAPASESAEAKPDAEGQPSSASDSTTETEPAAPEVSPAATAEAAPAAAEASTAVPSPAAPPKKMGFIDALSSVIIFVPTSYPHLVGMFVYITVLGYFLQAVNPLSMDFPAIPIPLPISLSALFSYNGLGLVMLSFCGVGIFVTRDWKSAMKRLGWERPTLAHVGIGLLLVLFSFCYDLIWSLYTHGLPGQDMATKLSGYNSGTFASGPDFGTSILIALCTAIFAGVGEETLTRGALQPALGIIPAAILHGVLHAQFSHAPILIIQVALWSIVFGIVRRFTNTTTTIIGHAGFNFVTTFLFAFNP